ncbi:MAG TPA: M1 family aminopeptidase [Hanamia sp.]|nr:M1 family aminopeptidase [Hanamia sp.]
MKKIFIFITFLYSTSYAQNGVNNFDIIKKTKEIAFNESQAFSRMKNIAKRTAASFNFDVKYYRCEWKTDPAVRYINGKVTSYFVITSATNYIIYDLSDSLHVDSVKEQDHILSFSQKPDNSVQINFNGTKPEGDFDSISIFYQGVPPNTGFGSFVNSIHDSIPIMWTLSEPYGSRDWWPCKNGLDDKADSIDVYITAPSHYSAVSNGLRQSEIIDGTEKITHWKHRYPIAAYLVCMAVTNYSEFINHVQIANTNLLMQTFCYPESLTLFQNNTPFVLAELQFYSNIFGPYPFLKEKYGQVQFGWGGGEEHQTSTFIVNPEEALMAHELGHQWFGDKVTCGSWQDIWLNEGFATFLASMYMENKYPLTATSIRKSEIVSITSVTNGSVFVNDTTNVNRIFDSRLTYTKGSHLLYMLRWILGDSVFFRGMRSYLNDSTLSYGFARTKDFQRNLERVSGLDLNYFFNDWFYGQGYPSYDAKWTQIGNDYVKIKMNQTTSDPSVNFFALPVALQFKNATQQKTVIINNTFNGETFFENIGFVADSVIIDPNYWLITKNNTSEKVNDDVNGNNVIQVFPNPVINNFYLYLRNFNSTEVHIKIFDSRGRLMLKRDLPISNSLFYELNVETFSSGIYFIKIQTDNGVKFVKKILKQ